MLLDVRILGFNVANGGKDLRIPVFILFRALGYLKRKRYLEMIIMIMIVMITLKVNYLNN